MKKFTKISLIFAGIFAALGIACWIAGLALGVTWAEIRNSLNQGEFSIGSHFFENWENGDERVLAEGEYEFYAEEVNNLNIDMSYATIEIQETDEEIIYMETTDEGKDKVTLDGDTLKLESRGNKNDEHIVVLYLPADLSFEEIKIDVSAGRAAVNDLTAEQIKIEVGAGEFTGDGVLSAEEADFSIGAGTMDFAYLDASEAKIGVGAGSVSGTLTGSQEDYEIKLECGVGSLQVGTTDYSGIAHKETVNADHGERQLKVECAVGEVDLQFENDHH